MWLHLLLPLTLLIGATVLVGVPILAANFAPPLLSKLAMIYLDWCAPVFIVFALSFQHWASKRLLAPYLEQVSREET
ncbi:hypothetical protein PS2015_2527 [Pseudohongiella spirulinae]|uniref:Uncharacterized protein n=1 Tax=Pseudohongiella spirulinae TaxID=1249552 RepID=A0A0S2KFZ3_9GAMM|nr:hypothetical protein PS2015_2527 [Pseudohongiella spirulinae]